MGAVLASEGATGRLAIDFAAARQTQGWRLCALEVNLRKGGTSHLYAVLRNLVPGRYDANTACWVADQGGHRVYCASDNLQSDRWTGLSAESCIKAILQAGLQFDPNTGVGTVLHMLSGLVIDGRFGLTAIAETSAEAERMQDGAIAAMDRLAGNEI